MRLENKMHKWLKFLLKSIPFWYLFFVVLTALSSDLLGVFDDVNMTDEFISNCFSVVSNAIDNLDEFVALPTFVSDFIVYISFNLFEWGSPFGGSDLIVNILSVFAWWIIIDFIDLIFGAFRFIINLAHSWLDSFYERSKRGGK